MGVFAKWFITVAVYLFAFTSIIANFYYSETNLEFIKKSSALLLAFRLTMVALLIIGALSTLSLVWTFAYICMGLMTLCNIVAIWPWAG